MRRLSLGNKILSDEFKLQIEEVVKELEQEYQENQGLVLTEDDLKCELFNRLKKINLLEKYYPVRDDKDILASAVHSEINWFKEQRNEEENTWSYFRPDLTILDPRYLRMRSAEPFVRKKLPNKQFQFAGKAMAFEIKFCKKLNIDSEFLDDIKADYRKIEDMYRYLIHRNEKNMGEVFFYQIIALKGLKDEEIESFLINHPEKDYCKCLVITGNLEPLS